MSLFTGMVPVSALMTGAVVQKYSVVTDNTTVTVDAADNLSTERSAADVAVTLTLLTGLIQVRESVLEDTRCSCTLRLRLLDALNLVSWHLLYRCSPLVSHMVTTREVEFIITGESVLVTFEASDDLRH